MKWALTFDWKAPDCQIKPADKLFFTGSCFAQNMANKLQNDCFHISQNPFGILYNPKNIADSIARIVKKELISDSDLVHNQGVWYSWFHHGNLHSNDKHDLISICNTLTKNTHDFFVKSDFVFATFGTTKVYQLRESQTIVANCHKVAQSNFISFNLTEEEIFKQWELLIQSHPLKKFFLSVSPIRYTREGLIESNNSKAVLRNVIMKLCSNFNNVYYIPAYEWVIDVLRDYRFFEADLVHPNSQAIDFVYEAFAEKLLSKESKQMRSEWQKIKNSLNHKPIHPDSETWHEFKEKTDLAHNEFKLKWNLI